MIIWLDYIYNRFLLFIYNYNNLGVSLEERNVERLYI